LETSPQDDRPQEPLPAFSPDGVDLTLIRWMLGLTPAQRLRVLQQYVTSILRIRDANARR
jgi:hypothetical protein